MRATARASVGIDRVAALHEQTENSILIDAGDTTQGLPIASLTQGADVIELMNEAGYDLMAAGNHEFDFGSEVLLENAARAAFPILSANAVKDGEPLLQSERSNGCHTIVEADGIRVGFFGLTTADTQGSVNRELLGGVTFADEVQTAREQIDALHEAGADAIVAVCHLGDESGGASCTAEELAEAMTGEYAGAIDVIIDAHSHTVENDPVNGTLVVQTGGNGSHVGKLTLSFTEEGVDAEEELLSPRDLAAITPEAEVAALLDEIDGSQSALLNTELGEIDAALWGGNVGVVSIARVVETNFGDLAADAFLAAAAEYMTENGIDMPLVSVENAGGIRGGVFGGTATLGELVTAFPYSNTVQMKAVTPAILYAMMEVSGVCLDGQDEETGMLLQTNNSGGFLQIGGFTVVYDATRPAGEGHVLSITLAGETQPLDREDDTRKIMLASNNYILGGGSDYTMPADLPKEAELGGELEAVQGYLEACIADGSIADYARPQGRIVMRGGYTPTEYTARIRILDEDSPAAAGTQVTYIADGGPQRTATVDGDGFIEIVLADGAHGIRLAGGDEDAYVDNYLGFGLVEDAFRAWPQLSLLRP